MHSPTQVATGARSLHKSLSLLRLVASHTREGIRLVDLCHLSGITRPTAHRMLQALQFEGLVEQDSQTDRYFLGREAYFLGVAAESRFGLKSVVDTTLSHLTTTSEDISLFVMRHGTHAVCIGREEGTYRVRTHTAQVGDRYPLGVGGASLAILATCPDDEIEWILQRNSVELARDYPIFTPRFLRELVAETRAHGYAVNPGRVFPESWGVAVAFHTPQGPCPGAVSLAGVPMRIEPRIPEVVSILKAEIPLLESRLYGSGPEVPVRNNEKNCD